MLKRRKKYRQTFSPDLLPGNFQSCHLVFFGRHILSPFTMAGNFFQKRSRKKSDFLLPFLLLLLAAHRRAFTQCYSPQESRYKLQVAPINSNVYNNRKRHYPAPTKMPSNIQSNQIKQPATFYGCATK